MAVSSVISGSRERASVLECGSPLPLFHRMPAAVFGTTAPPILSRLAQYGDGARALARFNAQSCGARKTPRPLVFWTVKRSRVRNRAPLAPPPCHYIVRASIIPSSLGLSRLEPMNQGATFLPGRGNRFALSPGVRASVKLIVPMAFVRLMDHYDSPLTQLQVYWEGGALPFAPILRSPSPILSLTPLSFAKSGRKTRNRVQLRAQGA